MRLIDTYAANTGSTIGYPFIYQKYFPLPSAKYITIHASSGMQSKNYDYWNDVLWLLKDQLKDFKIIQIGGKDDDPIEGVVDFRGKTDINQTAYILAHTTLHLCNDTFSAHVAGWFRKPLVVLYGATDSDVCGPYWKDWSITRLINADLKGNKPSWCAQESPKAINNIKPEEVARIILELLQVEAKIGIESLYFGSDYNNQVIELIPDQAIDTSFIQGAPNIRADYHFNETNIYKQLSISKCILITDQALKLDIIAKLKPNIPLLVFHFRDDGDYNFIEGVKNLGIPIAFITERTDDISHLKLKYADFGIIDQLKEFDYKKLECFPKLCDNTCYKTHRYLLSKGKIYPSLSHWRTDEPVKSFDEGVAKVKFDREFWDDAKFYYLFNKI